MKANVSSTVSEVPGSANDLNATKPGLLALVSALAKLDVKTEQEPAPVSWEPLVFKYGDRPKGMPGRGDFNLQDVLGLNNYGYKLVLVSG